MINWIPSLTWHLSFTHYPQHCSVENPCCSGPDSCFKHCLHHHHRNFSLPNWSLCLVLTLLLAAYPPENTIPPKSAHRHLITGGSSSPLSFPVRSEHQPFPHLNSQPSFLNLLPPLTHHELQYFPFISPVIPKQLSVRFLKLKSHFMAHLPECVAHVWCLRVVAKN